MAAHPKTELKLKVDFDGRQHPFHPDSAETAGELKTEAITFFRFVRRPEHAWKERWQIGKAASTVQRKDEAWPHVRVLEAVRLNALTPAMLEDAIADAARVAPRQAQLALGTVKQVLRDAMKRGQRVDPALLDVKAPTYEEREPVFLSAAEVQHVASWCSEPRLMTFAALSGLRLGEVLALRDADIDLEDGACSLGARLGKAWRGGRRQGSAGASTCAPPL